MFTPSNPSPKKRGAVLSIREMCIFAMLGALMFCSKIIMEALPNIHLLGMFTMAYTFAFGKKALVPIYIYVLVNGLFAGFSTWWIPYLYVWTVLWAATMPLASHVPKKAARFLCPVLCCLHGLAFGVLYAPAQALLFGLNFKQTLAWIAAGFPFDVTHGIGNFFTGFLVIPLSELLRRLMKTAK